MLKPAKSGARFSQFVASQKRPFPIIKRRVERLLSIPAPPCRRSIAGFLERRPLNGFYIPFSEEAPPLACGLADSCIAAVF